MDCARAPGRGFTRTSQRGTRLTQAPNTPNKQLAIDLRWIDASGVGVYIQGILPWLFQRLSDTRIVGIGDPDRLRQFPWSASPNFAVAACHAPRYSLAEQLELPRAIPRGTHLFFSPYYTIPLLYPGRLAVTVHDMSHRVVREITSNPKKRLYAQVMYRELGRRASLIFTVSHFTKSELLRLVPGVAGKEIIPTHLGVAPEWYRAGELPAGRERPYFIAVGNVKPYKNLGRLLNAFLMVKDRIPHDLVLVGQHQGLITGESPAFFASAREAGGRVALTGQISQSELLALVAHADALVMPSLYEGFGLPPLEAMAAGTPVIVASAGSLPEVCGDAAIYFDPQNREELAERLVAVATNPALRKQQGSRGMERSRLFRWETCGQATADGLRRALEGGG